MRLENLKPQIRHLSEIKEVLFDQKWAEQSPDLELYYMYRDLAENKADREKIASQGLRYDITILNPVKLGKEYNKTAGHDHPLVPNTEITYPEIYEVLEGEAIFLAQNSEKNKIKDIFAIKAKKNDKVIIPPNYEHLLINPTNQELKTANWICRKFSTNIYKPFRSQQGFAYYGLKNNGGIKWAKNEHYRSAPEIKFLEPNQTLKQFGIDKNKPLYDLTSDLTKLDFLKNPQNYQWK